MRTEADASTMFATYLSTLRAIRRACANGTITGTEALEVSEDLRAAVLVIDPVDNEAVADAIEDLNDIQLKFGSDLIH